MPIYEYVCNACGKVNDVLQKLNDPAPESCEGCQAKGTLARVVSRTSFVLKGGGWYSDLYSSSKKNGDGGTKGSAQPPSESGPGASSAGGGSTTSTSGPASSSSGSSGSGSSAAPASTSK